MRHKVRDCFKGVEIVRIFFLGKRLKAFIEQIVIIVAPICKSSFFAKRDFRERK